MQWLCHDCSCEIQLVPSDGVFSSFRWNSGGFDAKKRRRGRHLLSWERAMWEHVWFSPANIPGSWQLPWVCSHWISLRSYICHPGRVEKDLCWQPGAAMTTATYCHGASWVSGTRLLSQVAPCPQLVAMKPAALHSWERLVPAWWACGLMGNVVIVTVFSLKEKKLWFPMLVNQAAFPSTEF